MGRPSFFWYRGRGRSRGRSRSRSRVRSSSRCSKNSDEFASQEFFQFTIMRFMIEAGWTCSHTQGLRRFIVVAILSESRLYSEDDFVWPDHSRELRVCDFLACLGLGRSSCFWDITVGTRLLDDADILEWNATCFLMRRSCPRCTLCSQVCERSGPHILCNHGGTGLLPTCRCELAF